MLNVEGYFLALNLNFAHRETPVTHWNASPVLPVVRRRRCERARLVRSVLCSLAITGVLHTEAAARFHFKRASTNGHMGKRQHAYGLLGEFCSKFSSLQEKGCLCYSPAI